MWVECSWNLVSGSVKASVKGVVLDGGGVARSDAPPDADLVDAPVLLKVRFEDQGLETGLVQQWIAVSKAKPEWKQAARGSPWR
jgi:hypothetical protein